MMLFVGVYVCVCVCVCMHLVKCMMYNTSYMTLYLEITRQIRMTPANHLVHLLTDVRSNI